MAEKQNHKERLKEITDSIETGIKELFESDKYKSYLQTMSRFRKYSLNNTILITMQKPDCRLQQMARWLFLGTKGQAHFSSKWNK